MIKLKVKKKILITISVYVVVLSFFLIYSGFLSKGKWGKASNGVQAKIFSNHSVYLSGTKPKIFIKFRNIGKESVSFKLNGSYGSTGWYFNGDEFAGHIGHYPKDANTLTLLPGQISKNYYLEVGYSKKMGVYTIDGGLSIENFTILLELPPVRYFVFELWCCLICISLVIISFIILKFI